MAGVGIVIAELCSTTWTDEKIVRRTIFSSVQVVEQSSAMTMPTPAMLSCDNAGSSVGHRGSVERVNRDEDERPRHHATLLPSGVSSADDRWPVSHSRETARASTRQLRGAAAVSHGEMAGH